jgi:PAS domain S-box-containing protein
MSKKKINKPLKPLFNDFAPEDARPAKEPRDQSAQKPAAEETQAARRVRGTSQLESSTAPRMQEENALAITSAVSSYAGAMSLAFRTDEKNWATLRVVDEAEPRNWAVEEQMLVKQVADQLSLALENARLFQETRQREEEANLLNQIVTATTRSLDLTQGLQYVAGEIAKRFSALHAGIALVNEDKTALVLRADAPLGIHGENNIGLSIPIEGNPTSEPVVKTRQPLFINDTFHNPLTAAILDVLKLRGTQSLFIWPIFAGTEVIGSLGLDFAEPDRRLLESEANLISTILLQLNTFIQNARLFQETQRRAEELTAINQIISSASQVLDIRMMLENVLEQTLVIIGFTSGLVSLYNDKEQRLELIAHHNLPGPILENLQINGFQKSVCEYVYLTKESLYISDLRQGAPIPVEGLIATNILAYFGIPLKVKDQTIGTLCTFGNAPKLMDARLVDLTRSIGIQIGFALENARLFEETRGSQQALTRSEGELRALFAAMNDVIIVYDKEGRYIRIAPTNPSRLFLPPEDMLGKKVEDVLPEQTAHIILTGIHEALTTGQTVKLEYPLDIEQKEYWFEGNISRLNEEQVFLVTRDITDRKYNELLQAAITQITEAALSAPDITGLLQIIHENIKTLMPANNFSISLYDETTDLMTFPYYVDENHVVYHSQKPGQGLTSYVLRTGEALLVTPEVFDDLEKSGEVRAEDLHGRGYSRGDWLGVPLRSGTRRIGVMAVETYNPRIRLTGKDRDTLNLLAAQVAVAIERKRGEDALKRRNVYLAAASEIGRLVTSTLDLNTIFSRTVNLVLERFGFYHAAIFVVEETGFNAILREATGDAGREMKLRHHSLPVNERSIVGKATQTGKVVVTNDTATDKIHRPNPLLPDTRSEAAVPLHVGVRIIGALDIQSPNVDAFTPDDLSVLQILADQVAIAIDNARSYELSQEAVKEMRELDRMKSMFLANMSHELRTPLNSIIGFSRVILKGIDGPTSELQEQDLTAIYNSGQHLLGLINDILDVSKIEAGKMELAFDEVNMAEVINGVMSTVVGLVRDKQIQLLKNIPEDLPTARADAIRVRQILLNLLSNAAKFTMEGSITVEASVESGPAGHPEILISVIDTGQGINPKDQAKLFQAFSQVDDSLTRKTGGSGLGLSISQQLVQMHGGRIGVHSVPGEGSTFYFTLPVFRLKSEAAAANEGKVILAVDDDLQVISLYERYLQPQGYQIIPVTDASQAVKKAKQFKPYAITLDIMMPGYDGWSVLSDLKADSETRDIPVVICSIMEEQERGYSLGAADYLLKPIIQDDLLSALDNLNGDGSIRAVLVVDDDPSDLRLIEKILKEHGRYKAILADSGPKGWDIIVSDPPHAVILDLFMPDMDGFTILEKMREDPKLRSIPVVVVSGVDLTAEQHEQLKQFGQRLLTKGTLNESELLNTIEQALKRVRRTAGGA